jgi:TetR/AcrR family transcriptional regulator, regulator of mycofactocin system
MSDMAGRIERAAFALFAARGVEATTLEDVAEHAGVPLEVVQAQFASIDEILWVSADRHVAAMEAAVAATRGDASAAAAAGAIAVADLLDGDQASLRIQMDAVRASRRLIERHLRTREQWEALLAIALAKHEGLEEPRLTERVLAGVMHGAVLAALDEWYRHPERSIRELTIRALRAMGVAGGLTG